MLYTVCGIVIMLSCYDPHDYLLEGPTNMLPLSAADITEGGGASESSSHDAGTSQRHLQNSTKSMKGNWPDALKNSPPALQTMFFAYHLVYTLFQGYPRSRYLRPKNWIDPSQP